MFVLPKDVQTQVSEGLIKLVFEFQNFHGPIFSSWHRHNNKASFFGTQWRTKAWCIKSDRSCGLLTFDKTLCAFSHFLRHSVHFPNIFTPDFVSDCPCKQEFFLKIKNLEELFVLFTSYVAVWTGEVYRTLMRMMRRNAPADTVSSFRVRVPIPPGTHRHRKRR